MDIGKDVRFTEKKVDESWKNEVSKETSKPEGTKPKSDGQEHEEARDQGTREEGHEDPRTSPFIALISSLGMQVLIQLGEVEDPGSGVRTQDLMGAQATINLLIMLKQKTKGNLSKQEARILESLLYDLQMKFVECGRARAAGPEKNKK